MTKQEPSPVERQVAEIITRLRQRREEQDNERDQWKERIERQQAEKETEE